MALFLVVEQDTYFKLRPQQSPELEDNEKEFIQAGRTFELHSYAYADATPPPPPPPPPWAALTGTH